MEVCEAKKKNTDVVDIPLQEPCDLLRKTADSNSKIGDPVKSVVASPWSPVHNDQDTFQGVERGGETHDVRDGGEDHSEEEELEAIMKGLCLSGDSSESTISSKDVFSQLEQSESDRQQHDVISLESALNKHSKVREREAGEDAQEVEQQDQNTASYQMPAQPERETPQDWNIKQEIARFKKEVQTIQEPEGELLSDLKRQRKRSELSLIHI